MNEKETPYVSSGVITITDDNFQQEVLEYSGSVLIDFWADWCQPCRMMAPVFHEVSEIQKDVKFCKVNVDEQAQIANMFGISSIPTIVLIRNRQVVTSLVGVQRKETLLDLLRTSEEV